jgi:hypothetical protein
MPAACDTCLVWAFRPSRGKGALAGIPPGSDITQTFWQFCLLVLHADILNEYESLLCRLVFSALLGMYICFKRLTDGTIFLLTFALTSIYFSGRSLILAC